MSSDVDADPDPEPDDGPDRRGPPRFLFVGGPGRSGTTLMGRTLGTHPFVSYLEETFLLDRYKQVHDVTRVLLADAWPDAHAAPESLLRPGQIRRQQGAARLRRGDRNQATHRIARTWLQMMIDRLELPEGVILDKSPRDVAHYAWGVEHLPRSRYLVMRRDPRAVVASRLEQEERRRPFGYEPGVKPSSHVLERARFWAEQWVEYLDIAAEARAADPERVLFVDYRDMLLEPAAVAERAQWFLNIEPDPRVSDYLASGGYRDELDTDPLEAWQDRLHKRVLRAVVDTVGERLGPFE